MRATLTIVLVGCGLIVVTSPSVRAQSQVTVRVSVDSLGNEANQACDDARVSADGRFVVFVSAASNLVSGDTNGFDDIFVHDLATRTTTRVSVDPIGNQANSDSRYHDISRHGRYVAFQSAASNLVPLDTNAAHDIFVHDRVTGYTTRVSVDSAGNEGDGGCLQCAISADGDRVAFVSGSRNLVPGDTNGTSDVFAHDRTTGVTTRVSVDSAGNQSNGSSQEAAISADGTRVAFMSWATNLVPGDVNGWPDVFVHDLTTGVTTLASISTGGVQGDGASLKCAISGDGARVVFASQATNLVAGDTNGYWDVFLHDLDTGTTTRVSTRNAGGQANTGGSQDAAVNGDGSLVAFDSWASDLVTLDSNHVTDVFVKDLDSDVTTRWSVTTNGVQGNDHSVTPDISAAGHAVAFESLATNLVPNDTNLVRDVFWHGPELTLQAAPAVASLGQPLGFATWHGKASGGCMLFVVAVDGTPVLMGVDRGSFDGAGVWAPSYTVPNDPALVGLEVSFLSLGQGAVSLKWRASNAVDVRFE